MSLTARQIEEFISLRKKTNSFIKEVTSPAKKIHSDNIENYLDRFIKFPGGMGLISIIFSNSTLVKNQPFAVFGIILIFISLIVALNVFRMQIKLDQKYLQDLKVVEKPMVDYSRNLTVFSRDQKNVEKEKKLLSSHDLLQEMYDSSPFKEYVNDKFVNISMSLSFWTLVMGVLLLFSSTFCI